MEKGEPSGRKEREGRVDGRSWPVKGEEGIKLGTMINALFNGHC